MKHIILTTILCALSSLTHAFITYGNDAYCDYNSNQYTLQEIINLPTSDQIRITNQNTIFENLRITKSINLAGGFESCQAADANDATGKTIIDGGGLNSVVTIKPQNTTSYVYLDKFTLKNGATQGENKGGGISIIEGANHGAFVRISGSQVSNNNGEYGGGIFLTGERMDLALTDTLILNNGASKNGGGLYCYGGKMVLNDGSGVILNDAFNTSASFGHGGGIYAANECQVFVQSGTSGSLFDFKGISGNTASNHGGGIYATSESYISLGSITLDQVVNVNENVADSDHNGSGTGGGIHLSGDNTKALLTGALVKNNSAVHGGGFAVTHGANLGLQKRSNRCWNEKKCNVITQNKTHDHGGLGGAIYMVDGSAHVSYSFIEQNRADSGAVLYADSLSHAFFRTSYIYNNGNSGQGGWNDVFTLRLINSNLILNQVTMANNKTVNTSIHINGGSSDSYRISNSIIHEPIVGTGAVIMGATGIEDCLLLDNDAGFNHLTNSVVDNPYFFDEDNHDYHLSANSQAIDLCTDNHLTQQYDNDGDVKWDDPHVQDRQGTRDAGADESMMGDVIFLDSF